MKSKILLCLRYTDAVRSLWGLRGVSCDLPTGTPRPGRLESQRWVTTVTGVGEDLEKLEMLCVINRFCLHNVAEPHNGKLVTQKRNDVLMRATTQTNLENMLSKRSQSQQATYRMVHLYGMARRGTSREIDSRLVVARLGGEAGRGVTADGQGASLGG